MWVILCVQIQLVLFKSLTYNTTQHNKCENCVVAWDNLALRQKNVSPTVWTGNIFIHVLFQKKNKKLKKKNQLCHTQLQHISIIYWKIAMVKKKKKKTFGNIEIIF